MEISTIVVSTSFIKENNSKSLLLSLKNILSKGLEIHSSGSYSVSLNEVTVKPKVCKDEVGSCVATKHKTKVFVSFG